MAGGPSPEWRKSSRVKISTRAKAATELETSMRRGVPLSPARVQEIFALTNYTDPQAQMRVLVAHRDDLERQYMDRLLQHAPEDLSCFMEFMLPDLPPVDHHYWLCDKFEAISRRDLMRATFSMPPGHRKTQTLSHYGPAWHLGRYPNDRFLAGTYAQLFGEKQIGQYVRDIVADPRYRQIFPEVEIRQDSRAAGHWRLNTRQGAYAIKGVDQGISGYRGEIGGIDDPIGKKADAMSPAYRAGMIKWLTVDFWPRLMPGSPLYIVATRWHEDDMIGFVEKLNKEGKGIPWEIFNLTAVVETEEEAESDLFGRDIGEVLSPTVFPYEILMERKATTPADDWYALYKGSPRAAEGNVVKRAWLAKARYDVVPMDIHGFNEAHEPTNERVVKRVTVSVDCAEKATLRSKYTAVGVWIETVDNKHYLVDVRRKRVEYTDMIKLIEDAARDWGATAILVEDAGNGTPYIQQRAGLAPAPVIRIPKPSKDSKHFRFDEITPMWEAGEVWLPRSATWLPEYESEILSFPNGAYTDQGDMTSQYLAWARYSKNTRYGTRSLGGMHSRR